MQVNTGAAKGLPRIAIGIRSKKNHAAGTIRASGIQEQLATALDDRLGRDNPERDMARWVANGRRRAEDRQIDEERRARREATIKEASTQSTTTLLAEAMKKALSTGHAHVGA